MKNNLYFENVTDIGNLYLEYIFLEFYEEPIFFTCIDERGQLYLCLCSEIRGEQRWIISKSSIEILKKLVNGEVEMASAFELYDKVLLIKRDLLGKEESFIVSSEDIDPLDLPERGILLKCNQSKAKNYLTNKEFEVFSKIINSSLKRMYIEKAKNIYNPVFEINILWNINIETSFDDVFLGIFNENEEVKKKEYATNKNLSYQEKNDKNDIENIDEEYFFAA